MFAFTHNNFNVSNLERSLKFYKEALDLEELRRYEGSDFTQCWLGDHGASKHELELTWNWEAEASISSRIRTSTGSRLSRTGKIPTLSTGNRKHKNVNQQHCESGRGTEQCIVYSYMSAAAGPWP